ncbi:MAG: hypothetical protein A2Y17_10585 [Clostridiales bacterium GWF2_38_85]|nr:MAG: hypothetical protein A2Y17_10585 [Clostridiales bacterium GWF2_38_85]
MIFVYVLLGLVIGYGCMQISKKLIMARTTESVKSILLIEKYAFIFWSLFTAALFSIIYFIDSNIVHQIEYMLVFVICLMISAVDLITKKIPNILLLVLLILKFIFLVINYSTAELIQSLWGFGAACIIFALPSLLKLKVGAGDIKLAVITGFYLGLNGFLQTMTIMAIAISVFGIIIKIKKLGNFKTKTAMGPYLAFGFICTLLIPLF